MRRVHEVVLGARRWLRAGGLLHRKSVALGPQKPALKKVKRIQPSQNNPNSIVSSDTARLKRLINSRRVYRSMALVRSSGPRAVPGAATAASTTPTPRRL